MIIEESGKTYHIDDETGLVTIAAEKETELDQDLTDEFRLNDRVEVTGVGVGQIVSITASVYGPAIGVLFDNGDVDEYTERSLKRTAVVKQAYSSPIEEIFSRYATYEELPAYTSEERERKASEARWLNLSATTLRAYTAQGGIRDPKLEQIILVTTADIKDLKDISQHPDNNQEYLAKFNRYSIATEIRGMDARLGKNADASWLDEGVEGMEVVETTDADLAARATEMVARFTRAQLEDDDFMTLAASFQHEYLVNDAGREKKFAALLDRARAERINELKRDESHKVASVEENYDDIDDSALFM